MHVLNTKPKENSLVYVYFLFWITFKFILLPSAVSFRYYPINDYGFSLPCQKAAARPMKKHNNNKRKEKTNLLSETLKKIKKNLDKLKFGILASRKGFIYDIGN